MSYARLFATKTENRDIMYKPKQKVKNIKNTYCNSNYGITFYDV